MIAGESGLGKSTFIDTFLNKVYDYNVNIHFKFIQIIRNLKN